MIRRTRTSPGSTRRNSGRSEEHMSELQSQSNLVCRLLLEKKNTPLSISRAITSQKLMSRRTPSYYEEALCESDEPACCITRLASHLLVLPCAHAGLVTRE